MQDSDPTSAPQTLAIEVVGLRHRFKNHQALDGVDLAVARRSIHGFVGPNGAGKTTTLKAVATLMEADQGQVKVLGMDVRRHKTKSRRQIGYMPDHFAMYDNMLVCEYLEFFAAAYGMDRKSRLQAVDDVLELTDMGGRADSRIKGLSRGMQQRISLARVLVHDPEVLLLDEPASGLDPRARIELMAILRQLREMGKSIFISSHILAELADLCDSVTIIDAGQTRYNGSMEDLLARSDGGRMDYALVLDTLSPQIVAELRDLPGMDSVEQPDEGIPELHLSFHPQQLSAARVLERVVAANAGMQEFRRLRRHLDEAFLDLTQPGVRS